MKHIVKHVHGLPDEDQWWSVILPGEEADEEVCICNFEEQANRVADALNAAPDFLAACTPERLTALDCILNGRVSDTFDSAHQVYGNIGALLADLRAACGRVRGEGVTP